MVTKSSFDLFGLFIKFFNKSFNFINIENNLTKRFFFVNEYFFFLSCFLNYSYLIKKISSFSVYKDYRLYISFELIKKFKSWEKINRFFWSKHKSRFWYPYSNFILRVNVANFFVLGSYLEYVRMFFYNDHLRFCPFDSKGVLHLRSSYRWYLNRRFSANVLLNKYVIYLKLYPDPLIKFKAKFNLSFVVKFFFIFNVLTNSKYILFNNQFLVLCFGKLLFFYYMVYIYKNWVRFDWMFKFRVPSLWGVYLLSRGAKEDTLFVLCLGLFFMFSKCLCYLLNIKLSVFNLSFDFWNNFVLKADWILIDYISSLYLRLLENINVLKYRRVTLGLNYFWEIFTDWYYFDFLVFKDITQKILKFNFEYFCFQYNPTFLSNNVYLFTKVPELYSQSQRYLNDLHLYYLDFCLSYFIKNIDIFFNMICLWQVTFLRQFFFKVYYKNINIFFSYFVYKRFLYFINVEQRYTKIVYFWDNKMNG